MEQSEQKQWDWGRASADYARYRDIYPPEFFNALTERGIGVAGQRALDVGTGTGVIPRRLAQFGAEWTGVDASEGQIHQARKLSGGQQIRWQIACAEELPFADSSFDVLTAVQCFWYFDASRAASEFARVLAPKGRGVLAYVGWLGEESNIAAWSERSILRYNPGWSGANDTVRAIKVPEPYLRYFHLINEDIQRFEVPFTPQSWHGRLRACRGTRLEMPPETFGAWDQEHRTALEAMAPATFTIPHYAALAVLERI